MRKNIELHKRKVQYTLKVSNRAKRLRLAVYCDGAFVVTAPRYLSNDKIEQFIIRKSQWVLDKIDYFSSFAKSFRIKNTKADFVKYKATALQIAEKRIRHFNSVYNYSWNKITIKNQKTRWGSCSKKGNLNFNYKIALLPSEIADYIVVHELCHLKEFNHSQKFWNLIAKAIPNYLDIRNDLRRNGLMVR